MINNDYKKKELPIFCNNYFNNKFDAILISNDEA